MKKTEIEVLSFDELDVEALEQRLDMAIANGAILDGWICGCDSECNNCGTQCTNYCASLCTDYCGTLCGVDTCSTDCTTLCGCDGNCTPIQQNGSTTNMLPIC